MTNLSFLKIDNEPARPAVDCSACAKPAKCCAFQPFIANFLVGGWLEARGLNTLPPVSNAHWHPIGLIPAKAYREEHGRASEPGLDLACAFLDRTTRSCSIYLFRPGECATYFCDDERESPERVGHSQAVFDRELAVAQMAMVEMGLAPAEMAAQVDLVNVGSREDFAGPDLVFMYKKAWNWSKGVTTENLKKWMAE